MNKTKKTLELYPMTKDNNTLLYLYYWKIELEGQDMALEAAINVLIRNWDKLEKPRSILRQAQILQKQKDYVPKPQVVKMRQQEQEKWVNWAIEEKQKKTI